MASRKRAQSIRASVPTRGIIRGAQLILTSLEDGDTVGIQITVEDLDMLIESLEALKWAEASPRADRFRADLIQLRATAFPQ